MMVNTPPATTRLTLRQSANEGWLALLTLDGTNNWTHGDSCRMGGRRRLSVGGRGFGTYPWACVDGAGDPRWAVPLPTSRRESHPVLARSHYYNL